MSYTTKERGDSGLYDILETETSQVIEVAKGKDETYHLCRKLNLGAGFKGFTPIFFLVTHDNTTREI